MSAAPEVKIVPIGELIDVTVNGQDAGSLMNGGQYDTAEVINLIETIAKLCGATVIKA